MEKGQSWKKGIVQTYTIMPLKSMRNSNSKYQSPSKHKPFSIVWEDGTMTVVNLETLETCMKKYDQGLHKPKQSIETDQGEYGTCVCHAVARLCYEELKTKYGVKTDANRFAHELIDTFKGDEGEELETVVHNYHMAGLKDGAENTKRVPINSDIIQRLRFRVYNVEQARSYRLRVMYPKGNVSDDPSISSFKNLVEMPLANSAVVVVKYESLEHAVTVCKKSRERDKGNRGPLSHLIVGNNEVWAFNS
jgi:hypothetical protein